MTIELFLLHQIDAFDGDVFERMIVAVDFGGFDLVDHVHASGDFSEIRVLAVEPRRRCRGDDEELRSVGVRAGIRHGQ